MVVPYGYHSQVKNDPLHPSGQPFQDRIRIGGAALRDTTAPANYNATRTPSFVIGQNRAPTLTGPDVNPRSGSPGTYFVFTVTYADADSHLPVERALVVDGNSYYLVPANHRYGSGVVFRRDLSKFNPGWHRFLFRFSDGMNQVTSAQDSFFVGSTGLADARMSAPSGLRAHPSPFRRRVVLAGAEPGERLVVAGADGRVVRALAASNSGEVLWDGIDGQGERVPAGAYIVRGWERTLSVVRSGD